MSTPIRTVTFSATPSGVTPDQPQFAGVQGDHNATSVVFALDEALVNAAYQYRFEFVDGAGGYDTTDFVALENSQASCLLPGNWTGAGSTGTIRLCAVILGADNTEEQVVYTLSGRLKFAPRDTGTPMETEYEKGLSGLIADTKDAADGPIKRRQMRRQRQMRRRRWPIRYSKSLITGNLSAHRVRRETPETTGPKERMGRTADGGRLPSIRQPGSCSGSRLKREWVRWCLILSILKDPQARRGFKVKRARRAKKETQERMARSLSPN